LTLDTITSIAAKHKATTAQILLRWATQRGITVIPKSSNPKRLKDNLDNTDFDLSEDDIKTITGLDRGFRIAAGDNPLINIFA
jgi:D-xylose reductase